MREQSLPPSNVLVLTIFLLRIIRYYTEPTSVPVPCLQENGVLYNTLNKDAPELGYIYDNRNDGQKFLSTIKTHELKDRIL